ncbi:cyclic nucleotide-binding domain-containing protein [Paenibacillus oryzae]|nr:cyclic nucleotide-binding domain-containing protein [Paenibacillus oryzae]
MTDIVSFLKRNPLLRGVPDAELASAAAIMEIQQLHDGERFITEGEVGDCCYFIMSGQALVSSRNLIGRPVILGVLGEGALVGEIALLLDETRSADIKALGELTLLRLGAAPFYRLAEASPLFYESLLFSARIRQVHGLLRKATIWSSIADAELRGLAEVTSRQQVSKGDIIVAQGEQANSLYMIASGKFQAISSGRKKAILGSGDCFGEGDLLLNKNCSGTVTALEDGELLLMGKEEFHYILQQYEQVQRLFLELVNIRYADADDAMAGNPLLDEKDEKPVEPEKKSETIKSDAWINVLFILGGLFIASTALAIWLKHPIWVGASLLFGSVTGPVAFVSYIRSSQLLGYRISRLAQVFVLSAFTTVPLAWLIQSRLLFAGGAWLAHSGPIMEPIAVSIIEEGLKLLLCILILRSGKHRFLMDAVVFGAAVGMGFAAAESLWYGWNYLQQGTASDMLAVMWVRALLSPFGHGTWTAIGSAGLWFGLKNRVRPTSRQAVSRNSVATLLLLATSLLLHALWNSSFMEGALRIPGMLLIGAAGLFILFRLLNRGVRDESAALNTLNPSFDAQYPEQAALLEKLDAASSPQPALRCEACGTLAPSQLSYCARCGQALRSSP